MLELKLIRTKLTDTYTEGTLFNNNINEIICDAVEDKVRDVNADGDLDDEFESKVYGETAIPYGKYDIKVTYSNKFKMNMVQILNVKHFEGIRMHWGRSASNSLGCILCGLRYAPGKLNNNGMTKQLVKLLESHNNIGTIEII